MPQLLKPEKTTVVTTNTKQGECKVKITLDVNLNINSDGVVASVDSISSVDAKAKAKLEDDASWQIGNFAPPKKKIKFGKSV